MQTLCGDCLAPFFFAARSGTRIFRGHVDASQWPIGIPLRSSPRSSCSRCAGCATTPDLIVRPLPKGAARLAETDKKLVDALRRAETSYRSALAGKSVEARTQYDAAVADMIKEMSLRASSRQWAAPVNAGPYQLRFGPDGRGNPFWRPGIWTAILPAARVRNVHASTRVTGEGFGCPVILYREWSEEVFRLYPTLPQNGIHLPATAVLIFGPPSRNGEPRSVEFLLVNTRSTSVATIMGRKVPLAYDLTAPIEMQFRNPFILRLGWSGLRFPERYLEHAGIFSIQPYDRTKIPVVFVHGLNSDPHIWMNAMNAVLGDPVLRSRYQIWYFIYPTGQAAPTSARLLRRELVTVHQEFDPHGRGPGMNHTVLIGHSMGGILARMQVIDSGDDFRRAYFTKRIEQLDLSEENRERLRTGLVFRRLPWITRVVFLATPHRGSRFADLRVVRLVLFLIRKTGDAANLAGEILTLNENAINPDLRNFNSLGARSIETLSPRHPYFQALEARPILVPYHSIIGDRGRGDSPNSSDGVVPYWSSHLAGAQSETIIPAGHNLTRHEMTVEEIRRILYVHLRSVDSRKRVRPKVEEIRIESMKR